jgi:hypothetical protein
MALTIYDAMRGSQNPYQTMLLRQIATSDDMFSVVPFVPIQGEGFSYEREKALGSFTFIAPGGTVNESNATTERVTASNREATEDFFVPNFAQSLMSSQVSQLEKQTRLKLKTAGRAIAGKMITGASITSATCDNFQGATTPLVDALVSASPFIRDREGPGELQYTHSGTLLAFRAPGDQEFGAGVDISGGDGNFTLVSSDTSKWIRVTLDTSDATGGAVDARRRIVFTASGDFPGLAQQCPTGQIRDAVGTSGDALSFVILEELMDAVKNRANLAFVMNAKLRRKFNVLVRALGAAGPEFVERNGVMLPSFAGIPILTNDWIPSTETGSSGGTTLSSVYLANFAEGEGVYMAAYGSGTQNVEADPRDVSVMGFQLFELGQKQGATPKSEVGRRLCWFGTMACGSDLSIARAQRIITA